MRATASSGWRDAALWIATVLLSAVFLIAGTTKLVPLDFHVESFERWGYPMWFLYAVGLLEVVAAIGLLWPKTASVASGALLAVMLGAIATHLIHAEWGMTLPPLAISVLLGRILWVRRAPLAELWRRIREREGLGGRWMRPSGAAS